jgi:hypothetical protein
MDDIDALHTAARRYCRALHDEYWGSPGYRHLVLWPILEEVERLTPATWASLEEARTGLLQIGRTANDQFTTNPAIESAMPELQKDREGFIQYIATLPKHQLANVKPLPFRRVLSEEEQKHLWKELADIWGVDGVWHPFMEGDLPPSTLTFHTDYFDQQKIQMLNKILADHGHTRMRELRWTIGCEIAIESFDPQFEISGGSETLYGAGQEGFWTTANRDALIYVSHENSVTISGHWLVSAFEQAFPGCREFPYLGQISTPDRRGTW